MDFAKLLTGEARSMVKPEPLATGDSEIAVEILAYLAEYPNAGDTVEGIVKWWMPDRAMEAKTADVRAALDELVARGFICRQRREDSRAHYRINRNKMREIREVLDRASAAEPTPSCNPRAHRAGSSTWPIAGQPPESSPRTPDRGGG